MADSPTTLTDGRLRDLIRRLDSPAASSGSHAGRQPVHVVYGGAHLFTRETPAKLGRIATNSLLEYGDASSFGEIFGLDGELAPRVRSAVETKLSTEPIEDIRIDFEDGYGVRTAEEEDGHAVSTALEMAAASEAGTLPPFCGIRIRPLEGDAVERAIRTLDIFLTRLGGSVPENFIVTLPKVRTASQVATLAAVLDELESDLGLPAGTIAIEVMVETAASIIAPDGSLALGRIVDAGRGRVTGAHFGAFDYTAEFGITAAYQDLRHPFCDQARHLMQLALAGTGVFLSDGVTTTMPVAVHRGEGLTAEQLVENAASVRSAWRLHYDNIRHALASGFYQGWDLHPAQLVARYAAVYAFFFEGADDASRRFRAFIEKGARASLVGTAFDDAATGQGILNFFLRAVDTGAFAENEAASMAGVSVEDLRLGSFQHIIKTRQNS